MNAEDFTPEYIQSVLEDIMDKSPNLKDCIPGIVDLGDGAFKITTSKGTMYTGIKGAERFLELTKTNNNEESN